MASDFGVNFYMKVFVTLLIIASLCNNANGNLFFNYLSGRSSNEDSLSKNLSSEDLAEYLQLGLDSIDKQQRLEENLIRSGVVVENGSISHVQLLDSLPNSQATKDSAVALKILQSSMYIYHSKCAPERISGPLCEQKLAIIPIPVTSELGRNCTRILRSRRDGHHALRRLLPRKYKDGFYEMFTELQQPTPLQVSRVVLEHNLHLGDNNPVEDTQRNLALVQWAQFIEHDLSKPVATSMQNGIPIECCNKNNYRLQPRYYHPACAPLLDRDSTNIYGRETCLNYVRSALAVGSKCTFGGVEQLNQATADLDLSQLYGFTDDAQKRMRAYANGYLRATRALNLHQELLPTVSEELHTYCAITSTSNNSVCFMSGDSRVNVSPLAIVIYTIFLRNHNHIADLLQLRKPQWPDEQLFQIAKEINIAIYRQIIYNEWLPIVLGDDPSLKSVKDPTLFTKNEDLQISNEFAVAAIRFYYSMMPDTLTRISKSNKNLPDDEIALGEQTYKPSVIQTAETLDNTLKAILQQRALKMDTSYAESLRSDSMGEQPPTQADILAFDIQRGRDHGLESYVKYLEACKNIQINNWQELEKYMSKNNIEKLQRIYKSWNDIDLIVGGISELPGNGSIVGPTFSCILAEQFSRLKAVDRSVVVSNDASTKILELLDYKSITAFDVICANSDLEFAPTNIFELPSPRNPLKFCSAERIRRALRL